MTTVSLHAWCLAALLPLLTGAYVCRCNHGTPVCRDSLRFACLALGDHRWELQTEGFGDVHKKELCKQVVSINKHCDCFLLDHHRPQNVPEDSLPERAGWAPG